MHARALKHHGQVGRFRQAGGLRNPCPSLDFTGIDQGPAQEIVHDLNRNDIEHDGAQYLTDIEISF